jgi:hypothetical protein
MYTVLYFLGILKVWEDAEERKNFLMAILWVVSKFFRDKCFLED